MHRPSNAAALHHGLAVKLRLKPPRQEGGGGLRFTAALPFLPRFAGLAARGETPTAFAGRCIPSDCVAPPSNIPDILRRRALSAGRLARLGATRVFHHGLLDIS